jgi:hypothetical protein
MSKMDSWIIILIISFLVINIIVFVFGYKVQQLPYCIAILNLVFASFSIFYWIIDSVNNRHFNLETREIIILSIEVILIGFAIISLLNKPEKLAVNIVNYIGLGINFLAGIGMLIFMLIFKMNRLI